VPNVACLDPILHLPPILSLPLTTVAASASCGGPAFVPPATSPFSGSILDGSGHRLASLGTDCLYAGSGNAELPPAQIAANSTFVVNVVGLRGLKAIFGASDGFGPTSCTRGAGPDSHCLNGKPGIDGQGKCRFDGDCGGAPGSCALDANCYFAGPLPLSALGFDVCGINAVLGDFCGDVDLLGFATNVHGVLSTRLYLSACPECVSGVCEGGDRDGQSCGGSGSTIECPPTARTFVGALVSTPSFSTEPLELNGPSGPLCNGSSIAGAFGLQAARSVRTDGTRPSLLNLQATIAGPFCASPSGNPLIDNALGLPAPLAATVKAKIDVAQLLSHLGP